MSNRMSGFVSRRLSRVGLQLQIFWQKTLTSSHSIKQAFSPHSSPTSAKFPSVKPQDSPSQETFLPVFSTSLSHGPDFAHYSINNDVSPSRAPTLYADMATQTEMSTPPMDQSTVVADSESESKSESKSDIQDDRSVHGSRKGSCEADDASAGSEIQLDHQADDSEIYRGQSRVIVTDFDGKRHPTILVTAQMIEDLNRMEEFKTKLERMAQKLEAAKNKVELANINIRYYQSAIEEAEAPVKIAEFREELARRHSTFPEDEKRRDDLQEYADIFEIHRNNAADSTLDTLRTVLTDAGLLQTHFERSQFEPVDEDDSNEGKDGEQPEEGQDEPYSYHDDRTISEVSDVSIDELHRRTVYEEVREKYRTFFEAENQFDNRHQQYEVQRARWQQMVDDGECSMTQTEFDHCDFEVTQELANDMEAAEAAYEDALARRNKLGLGGSDQESGFPTDEYDGYPLSWENEGIRSAPIPFIEDWLKDIPEVENIPDLSDLDNTGGHEFEIQREYQEEMDEWDIRSAQMSDTWSCKDLTRNRKRIDRWNAITGRKK
ncbi:MAG: hypothetical protein Q9184_007859 [Pyrenodesmia sp. 2 TL-2023]